MNEHTQAYLISALALLLFGALASCFETAITASSRAKTHRLAVGGNKKAKILEKLLLGREEVVGTMILINNLTSILSSVLTTSVLISFFGEVGLVYATLIMTVLSVIFCDIGPKSLALKAPNQIALFFAPTIKIVVFVCFPIINYLQKLIDSTIALFFISKKKSVAAELEEIRDTVDLKHKEGGIYKYDKEMLNGILNLSEIEISEIMVHRKDIESINIDLESSQIIKEALKINHTIIPLWQGSKENIVATLNTKKLLNQIYEHQGDAKKLDIKKVISDAWFVPATNTLRAQLSLFRANKRKFALVVDEYSTIIGVVTLEDILEEIVGDIADKDLNFVQISKNTYKIAAKTLIRDVNKKLNWNITESEEAYNLSGLIIAEIDRIPEEREHFVIDGYHFHILKKNGNDIVLVKVRKIGDAHQKK